MLLGDARLQADRGKQRHGEKGGKDSLQHLHLPLPHDAVPARAGDKIDSEMEFGNGFVFSNMPSSGRITRKWRK